MPQRIAVDILNAALENLTAKQTQIDEQIAEIRRMLAEDSPIAMAAAPAKKKHHHISPAGRRAIALAQKRRWAAQKAEEQRAAKPAKKKHKLSAAGRAAIVAALKRRWAAAKVA